MGETKRVKVVETARDLKSAGFGKFVVGRRKFPSRFEWDYTTESLAANFVDSEVPLVKVERAAPKSNGKLTLEARSGGHDCQLRPGVVIDLSTLANLDLSDEEKETLTDAIATL